MTRTTQRRRTPGTASCAVAWLFLCSAGWCAQISMPALGAVDNVQLIPARAVIRFAATSTLHDFGGQLPAQPFILMLSNGTWSASADILSGRMATGNAKRDRNMHQMLATNDYPRIYGAATAAPIPGSANAHVMLTLKIQDKARDLPAQILNWSETADEIRFRAAWNLSLKQYGLKPPSVIGVIRVGDTVKLEADVTASKPVPPRNSIPHSP